MAPVFTPQRGATASVKNNNKFNTWTGIVAPHCVLGNTAERRDAALMNIIIITCDKRCLFISFSVTLHPRLCAVNDASDGTKQRANRDMAY